MEISFTPEELFIFNKISDAAAELNMQAYVIGGFVRDKILDRPDKDLDIVCVGDGIELAERAAAKFSGKTKVSFFKNFGTAQIRVAVNEGEFYEIEFVG